MNVPFSERKAKLEMERLAVIPKPAQSNREAVTLRVTMVCRLPEDSREDGTVTSALMSHMNLHMLSTLAFTESVEC